MSGPKNTVVRLPLLDGSGIGAGSHASILENCAAGNVENFQVKSSLVNFLEASPLPAFAIDLNHAVISWNKACERLTGIKAETMVGTSDHWKAFYGERRPVLADLLIDRNVMSASASYYQNRIRPSPFAAGSFEIEAFCPKIGNNGRWLFCTSVPIHDPRNDVVGAVEILQNVAGQRLTMQDLLIGYSGPVPGLIPCSSRSPDKSEDADNAVDERLVAESELRWRNAELSELNERLSVAREQLVQAEKLASIGQLAAGVAHEINNPIGYVFSNIGTLEAYIENLLRVLSAYEEAQSFVTSQEVLDHLQMIRTQADIEYIKEDMPLLLSESKEGIVRVKRIVQSLKDFSRADEYEEWQWADLHRGIDSTLNIVSNEVKYKADVEKKYGDIPQVECFPSQINQVVMNLVMNAAQSIQRKERGMIMIRTGVQEDNVWIEVEDTGEGIPKDVMPRIFDPFFTTKPVGSGTGLGLSLSYGIVQKHNGHIDVVSEAGRGTTFRVTLPIKQTRSSRKENV